MHLSQAAGQQLDILSCFFLEEYYNDFNENL
jgi:hypothetical protein